MFTGLSTARAQILVLERHVAALQLEVHQLREKLERSSQVALRADLDAALATIDSLRAQHRREMGKLWFRLREDTPASGRAADGIPSDDEFRAQLELQRQFNGGN